ncbi:hypothetical protein DMB66_53855 [Actinoplanes sp. ATCC 53533]|uniref:fibronectin type III domain-containing protein n=1 Tax=Actinoplanes sp. ATCC 53533 TaxID=1288362 RepID=UPI000F7726B8|nr:fibronectin type III domain-containing protein [Actinoplanes sp. ATCC 53533]RSM43071.1 hypothetical protein DMB66_53855 [Actinoplanes sp. ATCC 53533]
MELRRVLNVVAAGLLGAAVTAVGTPTAATAAPAAPKGLSVARSADDVHKIRMTWKAGDALTDHYVVDIVAGDVETVINVPASTTEYTIDAPDACTSYKMRVGAADAAGAVTNTGFTTLRSLTPGFVMGMATGREEDGTVATATWRPPSWMGYTPLTAYRVVFTRLSDGVVLADRSSTETSFRFPGVDATRAYTISLSTVNEFGACSTAKSLLDRYRPADPTGLIVQRRADAPGIVEVVWQAPKTGPAPTYYQVGYGPDKITGKLRVDAPTLAASLTLDATKSWMLEVKAYNDNGGSGALTGYVPVWVPTAAPEPVPSNPPATGTDPGAEAAAAPTTTTTVVGTGPDRTPPTITAALSQAAVNGWFRAPVTIHFTCADTGGTVATCPADIQTTTDSAALRVSGTAVDGAGNTTTSTMTLRVDRTAPMITATVAGTPNAAGWYTSPPVIHYTCADAVSMISTCPADTTVNVDGAGQKITGTAYDKAGNTATATVELNIDRTVPTITATVLGEANADGWYSTPPTVHYTCSDRLSGIEACPADRLVDTEGLDQQIAGTVVDKAGNTATATVTLDIDRTAPTITATVVGDPNADGWHHTAPTVHFTCTDEGSGAADCPADMPVTADGAGQQVAGTVVDKAGNTATATVTVNVDQTAPVITPKVEGEPNSAGWLRTEPTVTFLCTDTVSTVATCPAAQVVTTQGAGTEVTGTAADKAGNTAAGAITVNVDATAPVTTVTGIKNGGVYDAKAVPSVSCKTTDEGSGVATEAALTATAASGKHTVRCAGAVDKAGNPAAAVTATYTVNASIEWLRDLTHQYLDGASPGTVKGFDKALDKGNMAQYIAEVIAHSAGRKPALTQKEGATLLYWALVVSLRR